MTRVQWSVSGEKTFETGIDRAMFYPIEGSGIAWNGLTRVSETPIGGTPKELFLDGEKVLSLFVLEEYAATIEAFASPQEFGPCVGIKKLSIGFYITNQPRIQFGFSYRTLIGDDVQGTELGYKLHLVYNALAQSSDFVHSSSGSSSKAVPRTWPITTLPEAYQGYKPVAHFVLDSRKVDPTDLSTIEDILYGTDMDEPRLLSPSELASILYGTGSWFSIAYGAILQKKKTVAGQILADDNASFVVGAVKRKKMRISGSIDGISVVTGAIKRDKMKIVGSGTGGINQSGAGYKITCYSPTSTYVQGDNNVQAAASFDANFPGQSWATVARKIFKFGIWPVSPAATDLQGLVNLGCQIWFCCKPDVNGADYAAMETFIKNWLKYMPPEQLVMVPWQEVQNHITAAQYKTCLGIYSPMIHSYGVKVAYNAAGGHTYASWEDYTPDWNLFDIMGVDLYGTAYKGKCGGTESGGVIINKTDPDPLARGYAIADASPGGRIPFCVPEFGSSVEPQKPLTKAWFTDYIHYIRDLLKSRKDAGKPGSMNGWFNGNVDAPNTNTINGPHTTVASGSNGGNIRNIATWNNPAPGELAVASTTATPFDPNPTLHSPVPQGWLFIQLDTDSVAAITYAGISGNRFTGCQWNAGTGNVITGGFVSQDQFDSGTTTDWRVPILSNLYSTVMSTSVSVSVATGSITKKKMRLSSVGGPIVIPFKIGSAFGPTGSFTRQLPVENPTTDGSTIVVLTASSSSSYYAASVSDSKGNIYTPTASNTVVPNLIAWRCEGATGGSDGSNSKGLTISDIITITMNSTQGMLSVFAASLPGSLVAYMDVAQSPVAVNNTEIMTAAAIPNFDDDIAIALFTWIGAGGPVSISAPYISLGYQQGGTGPYTAIAYRLLGTGTSGFSQEANGIIIANAWKACMLLFKHKLSS